MLNLKAKARFWKPPGRLIKTALYTILFCYISVPTEAQTISTDLFGQNAWYIDVTNTTIPNFSDDFVDLLPEIAASGTKFIRIGGIDPNFKPLYNFDVSFNVTSAPRLIHLIDEIRAAGMEPIIEVGYNPVCPSLTPLGGITMANQAKIAGSLVKYLNDPVTGYYNSAPIYNWIIANEPDLGSSCSSPWAGFGYDNTSGTDVTIIGPYIQRFSIEMKNAFSTITVIGPELTTYGNDATWRGNTLMNDLLSNPALNANSIMGTSADPGASNGKYYIDVVSFHYYPNQSTRAAIIGDPIATSDGFKNKVSSVGLLGKRGIVQMISTNTTRTSSNLKIACTEFNISNNDVADESTSAGLTTMIQGIGYRSFLGGQWMAEMFSEGMSSPWMRFMNPWSTQEGTCTEGQGYISSCGTSSRKRPTYWHYQMVANNFSGTYFPNTIASGSNYKAFACTTATEVRVIIMNQTEQSPRGSDTGVHTFKINFNGGTPTGATMLFSFNAGVSSTCTNGLTSGEYSCSIQKETTMYLAFNKSTGCLTANKVYSLQDALRANDVGPNSYVNSGLTINSQLQYDNHVSSNVYPTISIAPTTTITAASDKVFQFVTSAEITDDFDSGTGKTLEILPTTEMTCY